MEPEELVVPLNLWLPQFLHWSAKPVSAVIYTPWCPFAVVRYLCTSLQLPV